MEEPEFSFLIEKKMELGLITFHLTLDYLMSDSCSFENVCYFFKKGFCIVIKFYQLLALFPGDVSASYEINFPNV